MDRAVFRRLRVSGLGLLGFIACVEIIRAGLATYLHFTHTEGTYLVVPIFSGIVLVVAFVLYRFVSEPAYAAAQAVTAKLEEQHQSDAKLVDRFSSIFDYHSDAAVAFDTSGRYTMVNAAAERLTGYHADEFIGHTLRLTPPRYALQVHEAVSKALVGEPVHHIMELQCKDGTLCPVSCELIPMFEGGVITGVFGFMKDISETVRAQRRERTQRDRFRAVSILAGAGGDVNGVIDRTLTFAIESLGADASNVALLHDDGMTIVHGVGDSYQRGAVVPVARSFSRHVIGVREVLVVRDADEEPWASDAAHKWQPWRSLLATTLFIDGVPAGVLSFVSREPRDDVDDADQDFVLVIASLIASALEREQRERQPNEMAFVDPLTTLPNRAYLSEQLDLAIAASRRDGVPFAVQYVDLDGFKDVNDRLGHEVGDQVLSVVAARLKMVARESDVVARIGGDEFVVLQTRIDGDEAITRLASRLVDAAAEAIIVNDEIIRLGASIGVARFPSDAQTAEDLLRCADEAMYRAKRAGRNRLEIFA
jgi:diguanylate cyclase (GGDEF)-like protein/PAS domain S-box-containing protein